MQKLETLEKHNQALQGVGQGEDRTSGTGEDGLYLLTPNNKKPVGFSTQTVTQPVDHQDRGLSNDRVGNQVTGRSQGYEFLRQRHRTETDDFDKAIKRVGRTTRVLAESIERFTRFIRELVEIIVENTRYRPVVGHSLKQSGGEDGPVISKRPAGQDLDWELGE